MESSVPFNEFQKLMGDDIQKSSEEEPKIVELDDDDDGEEEVMEVTDEDMEEESKEEKKVLFKDPIKEERIIEGRNEEEKEEEEKEEAPKKTFEELLEEYLVNNKPTILFATISNNDNVSLGFHQSMTQLATHFTKLNIDYDTITIHNEPITVRAKNCIVARVLSDDKYTHLMFIDTNITFSWKNVLELIMKDKDLSGGATPKRNINWAKVKETVIKNNEIENAHLFAKSLNYHFAPVITKSMIDDKETQQVNMENNMVEVHHLTSSFMLIKRNVLETMAERLGIMLKFTNTYEEYNNDEIKDHFYSFFERERTDNGYVDEDETFCRRWSKCKGTAWVDLMFNLNTSYYSTNIGSLYLSSVN